MNNKLKNDVSEGKDFEYIDEKTWNILFDEYEGYDLKRIIQDTPDGKIV